MLTRLLLAAFAAFTLACNTQSASTAAKPDNDLYAYLPPDATLIAGARVAHLRKSPLYKTLLDRLPAAARPYEKDANEIVVSTDGLHTLVLARGKFNPQQLEHDLGANGASGSITTLAPDLIALSDPSTIAAARKSKDTHVGSPLTAQIPATADLWLITNGHLPIQLPERSNLSNLNRLAQDLRLGVAGFQITDAIQADTRLDFTTDAASEQAHTALRGFIGLARLSTPNGKEQLLNVLDRLMVSRDKSRVVIKADWPPDLVQTLISMIPAR
jgi:hypothetical protein